MKKYIFIYGYYGAGNLGDDLLLGATIRGVTKKYPDSHFRIRNFGKVNLDEDLRDKVELTNIESIIKKGKVKKILSLFPYFYKAYTSMNNCSHFILGGGTLIHATTSSASLVLLASLMSLAHLRGLKIVGIGLGVMDLESFISRMLAKYILSLSSDFCVRDRASFSLLPKSNNVRVTADLVFSHPITVVNNTNHQSKTILVSLWSVPPSEVYNNLECEIIMALNQLIAYGFRIRFLVFQNAENSLTCFSDLPAINKMRNLLDNYENVSDIVTPEPTNSSIATAYDNCSFHIGARYHAALLGVLFGIPTIGISTEPKITSLCQEFSFPYLIPSDISCSHILDAVKKMDVVNNLEEITEVLITRSINNFDKI